MNNEGLTTNQMLISEKCNKNKDRLTAQCETVQPQRQHMIHIINMWNLSPVIHQEYPAGFAHTLRTDHQRVCFALFQWITSLPSLCVHNQLEPHPITHISVGRLHLPAILTFIWHSACDFVFVTAVMALINLAKRCNVWRCVFMLDREIYATSVKTDFVVALAVC